MANPRARIRGHAANRKPDQIVRSQRDARLMAPALAMRCFSTRTAIAPMCAAPFSFTLFARPLEPPRQSAWQTACASKPIHSDQPARRFQPGSGVRVSARFDTTPMRPTPKRLHFVAHGFSHPSIAENSLSSRPGLRNFIHRFQIAILALR
ncbi:hypothetical protein [Burkholderia singularis]|uniref:hypothetical protein n=1 Tax=Burkholderia singularis TaxID=1503053 RepID=UPI000F7AA36B|nr:hypothetical protein [Burkholderia singularis]